MNTTFTNTRNSTTESAVRSRAKTRGLKLQKSRSRCKEWPGHGTFHVIDRYTNMVVHGGRHDTFGLSLTECAEFIDGYQAMKKSQPHG